jgi:hypothetical protein
MLVEDWMGEEYSERLGFRGLTGEGAGEIDIDD